MRHMGAGNTICRTTCLAESVCYTHSWNKHAHSTSNTHARTHMLAHAHAHYHDHLCTHLSTLSTLVMVLTH